MIAAGRFALLGGLVLALGTVLVCVGFWAGDVEDSDTIGTGMIIAALGYCLIALGATNWLWALVIAMIMFPLPSLVCEALFSSTKAYGASYAGAFILLPLGVLAALVTSAFNGLWRFGLSQRPSRRRRRSQVQ